MIELTREQLKDLRKPGNGLPRVLDPETRELFVLLPLVEYERLKEDAYDDGPWTDEERDLLRAEACDMLDSFGKDK
ncbi:MAG: hypothetical protein U0793_07585 [Gemmataceae bacterium]